MGIYALNGSGSVGASAHRVRDRADGCSADICHSSTVRRLQTLMAWLGAVKRCRMALQAQRSGCCEKRTGAATHGHEVPLRTGDTLTVVICTLCVRVVSG